MKMVKHIINLFNKLVNKLVLPTILITGILSGYALIQKESRPTDTVVKKLYLIIPITKTVYDTLDVYNTITVYDTIFISPKIEDKMEDMIDDELIINLHYIPGVDTGSVYIKNTVVDDNLIINLGD